MKIQSLRGTEFALQNYFARVRISPNVGGAALAIVFWTIVSAVLLLSKNEALAMAAVAAFVFVVVLITIPPFWLALLLVALIPFENLITALLGGFDSSARQLFAMWKEVLLAIGIFRVVWHNPNRRQVIASNRWVLILERPFGACVLCNLSPAAQCSGDFLTRP